MINTVIVAGGNYPNENYFMMECKKADYIIAADSGYDFLEKLGIQVDFLIGDFDSINSNLENVKNPEILQFPKEKDLTDLHIAINKSISLKSNCVTIFGGTGTRLDHTLTNIFLLKTLSQNNIEGKIIDNNNEIMLKKGDFEVVKTRFKYLSILPLKDGTSVSLSGVKYPLEEKILSFNDSLCVSNEISEEVAKIKLSDYSIVIQSID